MLHHACNHFQRLAGRRLWHFMAAALDRNERKTLFRARLGYLVPHCVATNLVTGRFTFVSFVSRTLHQITATLVTTMLCGTLIDTFASCLTSLTSSFLFLYPFLSLPTKNVKSTKTISCKLYLGGVFTFGVERVIPGMPKTIRLEPHARCPALSIRMWHTSINVSYSGNKTNTHMSAAAFFSAFPL